MGKSQRGNVTRKDSPKGLRAPEYAAHMQTNVLRGGGGGGGDVNGGGRKECDAIDEAPAGHRLLREPLMLTRAS